MSLLRMLRQFHYIDPNGKDQGINVRNRSQELTKLLGDVDAIRAERKKARANRNKFGGMEGGGGGFSGQGSGRYGGFGSDSYGGYSGGVFGDGGGFGGASNISDISREPGRRSNRFEEYDEGDDEVSAPVRRRTEPRPQAKEPEPPKPKEVDLFDFGDEDEVAPATSTAAGKQPAAGNGLDILGSAGDDDDFDDFQSATPAVAAAPSSQFSAIPPPASTATTTSSTQFAAPKPVSASQGADLSGLAAFSSASPTPTGSATISPPPLSASSFAAPPQQKAAAPQQPAIKPTGYQAATPNYYTSVNTSLNQPMSPSAGGRPGLNQSTSSFSSLTATSASPAGGAAKPAASKSSGGDAFGSLWSTASAGAGIQKNKPNKGPNLASMAQQQSSAGIWGAPAATSSQPKPSSGGSAFDDLLG